MVDDFEIRDNGLYYLGNLVGTFVEPTKYRYEIDALKSVLDSAHHPLTKYFLARETDFNHPAFVRAAENVGKWKDDMIKQLNTKEFYNTPVIPEYGDKMFDEECVIEWFRVFCLDMPILDRFKDFTHNAVREMIDGFDPDEFDLLQIGAPEERYGESTGTLFDLLEVSSRAFFGNVEGDWVTMRFVRDEPFINIADRDLALRVFNEEKGEWTRLMGKLSCTGCCIKELLRNIASTNGNDEDENDDE